MPWNKITQLTTMLFFTGILCTTFAAAGWFTPDSPPPLSTNISNLTATGNCPFGFVVQNLTHGGPQCIFMGGGGLTSGAFNYTNIHGSDLTGVDGGFLRTYTISSLDIVVIDNFILHPDIDYNFGGGLVAFNNPIWDTQDITLYYVANPTLTNFSYYNYVGANTTGLDGNINRVLVLGNDTNMIAVDNYMLHPLIDYVDISGNVTFINPLWDTQQITVWVKS